MVDVTTTALTEWESANAMDVKNYVDQNGVSEIAKFFKKRLESWKYVEVHIGITGDSGTGKSSFINAIRGLDDDDDAAAQVDVTETTSEPRFFDHPTNPNIKFWDLPGIGTPSYPDLETYRKNVKLDNYHTFLIFASTRFTENDIKLAQEINEKKKSFFFIRTKIDENLRSEQRKRSFKGEADMLQKIRRNCLENLVDKDGNPLSNEEDVFLISNHHPTKWDFGRLTQAILDALPRYQRESLTLSLAILTSLSKDILQRKVDILKGRMWMVAAASAAVAAAPVPGFSFAVDIALVLNEVKEYIVQLGIPKKGSGKFSVLSVATQGDVTRIYVNFATISGIAKLFGQQAATETVAEELARFIPIVGSAIAGGVSFGCTYYILRHSLKKIEEVALAVLVEAGQVAADEFELD